MVNRPEFGGHAYYIPDHQDGDRNKIIIVRQLERRDPALQSTFGMIDRIRATAMSEANVRLKQKYASSVPDLELPTTFAEKPTQIEEVDVNSYFVAEEQLAIGGLDLVGFGRRNELNSGDNSKLQISDLFAVAEHHRFVRIAILRSLLDDMPKSAGVEAINPIRVNPQARGMLRSLGFTAGQGIAVQDAIFGARIDTVYEGPSVGELIWALDTDEPWLNDRLAFGSHQNPLS